jgi:hypothetical protein
MKRTAPAPEGARALRLRSGEERITNRSILGEES